MLAVVYFVLIKHSLMTVTESMEAGSVFCVSSRSETQCLSAVALESFFLRRISRASPVSVPLTLVPGGSAFGTGSLTDWPGLLHLGSRSSPAWWQTQAENRQHWLFNRAEPSSLIFSKQRSLHQQIRWVKTAIPVSVSALQNKSNFHNRRFGRNCPQWEKF